MIDREKVIRLIEEEISVCESVNQCYRTIDLPVLRDILALLKEQEAVEPVEIVNEHFPIGDYRRTIGWLCGKCGKALMGDGDYCSYCGRKVKWE